MDRKLFEIVGPTFEGCDSPEPSLRVMILRYYQGSGWFSEDCCEKLTELYIERWGGRE